MPATARRLPTTPQVPLRRLLDGEKWEVESISEIPTISEETQLAEIAAYVAPIADKVRKQVGGVEAMSIYELVMRLEILVAGAFGGFYVTN